MQQFTSQPHRQPSFLGMSDSVLFRLHQGKGNYPVVYPTVHGKYAKMTSRRIDMMGVPGLACRSASYDCTVFVLSYISLRGLRGLKSLCRMGNIVDLLQRPASTNHNFTCKIILLIPNRSR